MQKIPPATFKGTPCTIESASLTTRNQWKEVPLDTKKYSIMKNTEILTDGMLTIGHEIYIEAAHSPELEETLEYAKKHGEPMLLRAVYVDPETKTCPVPAKFLVYLEHATTTLDAAPESSAPATSAMFFTSPDKMTGSQLADLLCLTEPAKMQKYMSVQDIPISEVIKDSLKAAEGAFGKDFLAKLDKKEKKELHDLGPSVFVDTVLGEQGVQGQDGPPMPIEATFVTGKGHSLLNYKMQLSSVAKFVEGPPATLGLVVTDAKEFKKLVPYDKYDTLFYLKLSSPIPGDKEGKTVYAGRIAHYHMHSSEGAAVLFEEAGVQKIDQPESISTEAPPGPQWEAIPPLKEGSSKADQEAHKATLAKFKSKWLIEEVYLKQNINKDFTKGKPKKKAKKKKKKKASPKIVPLTGVYIPEIK